MDIQSLLKNKKVVISSVGLLSVGALGFMFLQQPEKTSKMKEIKTAQIKESPEKIKDNKDLTFDNNSKKASDGAEIIQGDYDINSIVELPDLANIPASANNYAPTRDDALLQARLTKIGHPVEGPDAKVQLGDTAIATVTALENGTEIPAFSFRANKVTLGTKLVDSYVENAIAGMGVNEEKEINVDYPSDYSNEKLKGKKITYKIVVSKIVRPEEPSAEEVDKIYQSLVENANYSNQYNRIKDAKVYIRDNTKIKAYPAKVVSRLEDEYKEFFMGVKYKDEDDFFKKTNASKSDYYAGRSEYVKSRIKDELILEALATKTGLTRDSDEYKQTITNQFNADQKRDALFDLDLKKILG